MVTISVTLGFYHKLQGQANATKSG